MTQRRREEKDGTLKDKMREEQSQDGRTEVQESQQQIIKGRAYEGNRETQSEWRECSWDHGDLGLRGAPEE